MRSPSIGPDRMIENAENAVDRAIADSNISEDEALAHLVRNALSAAIESIVTDIHGGRDAIMMREVALRHAQRRIDERKATEQK